MIKGMSFRAGIAALVAASALVATPARADYEDIYTAGHADINIGYDEATGAMTLDYELASNAVINGVILGGAGAGLGDADTITTFLGPNAAGIGPAGLPAPFANNPLWTIPQTSRAGRPFLGIGAEEIFPGIFQSDVLNLRLESFGQRPAGGEFVLWQNGSESTPFINSADGLSAADLIVVDSGGHDHYNFGFSKQGIYDLSFRASGTLANGTAVSVLETFRFQVDFTPAAVPEPSSLAMIGLGMGAVVSWRRRRARALGA